MATILYSGLVGDIRGSVNGWVLSANKNGSYIRNKTTPTNPSTAKQLASRAHLRTVIDGWRSLRNDDESNYEMKASTTPRQNRVGQETYLSGYQLYVKRNLQLVQIGLPLTSSVGPDPVFPDATVTGVTLEAAADGLSFTTAQIDLSDDAGNANQTVVVSVSPYLTQGARSTRQRYNQALVDASAQEQEFSFGPGLIEAFGAPVVGAKVFVAIKVVDNTTGVVKQIGIGSAIITQAAA